MFGPGVQILTPLHPMDAKKRAGGLEYGAPISIGEDVWVGGGAIICPGVKIGSNDGWVLALPDPEEPITHLWAESGTESEARRIAQEYARRIRQLIR